MNRKRPLNLHLMLSENEKELIKLVASLKGITVTDLIINLVQKEYQKLEMEVNK